MAYNNGFPISYQPLYPQVYQVPTINNQPTSQQPTHSGIIWVQGEAGAKSYLVAPNTTVQLWDSENQVIYLKSADASGMPSMKIIDYKVRKPSAPTDSDTQSDQFITKDEFDSVVEELGSLRKKVESINKRNGGRYNGKPSVQLNAD